MLPKRWMSLLLVSTLGPSFALARAGESGRLEGGDRSGEDRSFAAAKRALGPAVGFALAARHPRKEGGAIEKHRLTYRGLPVFGAGVRVAVQAGGASELLDRLELAPRALAASPFPAFGAREAEALASRLPGHPPLARGAELGFLASVGEKEDGLEGHGAPEERGGLGDRVVLRRLRLVWRVGLYEKGAAPSGGSAPGLPPLAIATLDGRTGELLEVEPNAVHATAFGQGYYSGLVEVQASPASTPGTLCLTDLSRGTSGPSGCGLADFGIGVWSSVDAVDTLLRVTDGDGLFGNGAYASSASSLLDGTAPSAAAQTTAVDALDSLAKGTDFYREVVGRSWLGQTGVLPVRVNTTRYKGSAAAVPSDGSLWIGLPDKSVRALRPMSDLESVLHEYSHLVLGSEIGYGSPGSELAALHEGFADIAGVLGHAWAGGPAGRFDPLEPADWVWGDVASPGEPSRLRYLDRPSLDQRSVDAYGRASTAGVAFADLEPQYKSGPLRRWFYFLAEGVERLQSTPPAPGGGQPHASSYLPQGMEGIGVSPAFGLLYRAFADRFRPGTEPTYQDLRQATEMQAQLDSGLPGEACPSLRQSVRDAWAAVNVGLPADRVPPQILLAGRQEGQQVVINAAITEAGTDGLDLATVQLRLNGTPRSITLDPAGSTTTGSSWTGVLTLSVHDAAVDPAGLQTVSLSLSDACHNGSTATANFLADKTPPAIAAVTDVTTERRALRSFRIQASDPASIRSLRVTVGGQTTGEVAVSPASTSIDRVLDLDLAPEPHGSSVILAAAEDAYGNRREILVPGYFVDRQAPQLCEVSECGQKANGNLRGICNLISLDDGQDGGSETSKNGVQLLELWLDDEYTWAQRGATIPHDMVFFAGTPQPPGSWLRSSRSAAEYPLATDHTGRGACTDGWGNTALAPARSYHVSDLPAFTQTNSYDGGLDFFRVRITASDGPDNGDDDSLRRIWLSCGPTVRVVECPVGGPPCLTLTNEVTGSYTPPAPSVHCVAWITDVYGVSRVWEDNLSWAF